MKLPFEVVSELLKDRLSKPYIDITEYCNRPEYVRPRFVYIYMLRKYTTATVKEIGAYMNRNYGSVLHACKMVNRMIYVKDIEYWHEVKKAESVILQHINYISK